MQVLTIIKLVERNKNGKVVQIYERYETNSASILDIIRSAVNDGNSITITRL